MRNDALGKITTMRPRTPSAELDVRIADLATRQHGVVAHRQLVALGASRRAIQVRLEHGGLQPLHRGVYAAGHVDLSLRGRRLAAVLAGGPEGAFLSHASAAMLHGLLPDRREVPEISVRSPRRRRPGLIVHRTSSLDGATTTRQRIPCTTVSRTLIDLAGSSTDEATRRAWSSAASLRLIRPAALRDELERNRPGSRLVRQLLDEHDGYLTQRTRSALERDALRLCREAGLPRPLANRLLQIGGRVYEADLLWPGPRLIVEIDGGTHANAVARGADGRRDTDLQLAGWRTCRLNANDLARHRTTTASRIRGLLSQPALPPADGWEPDGGAAPGPPRAAAEGRPSG